jgi:hypothetical protein
MLLELREVWNDRQCNRNSRKKQYQTSLEEQIAAVWRQHSFGRHHAQFCR